MKLSNTKTFKRRKEQFHCYTECGKYFLTYLRQNMTGNYAIKCPQCHHLHYRKIVNGLVTGDRRNDMRNQLDIIEGLESTLSDQPHDLQRENMRIVVNNDERNSWLRSHI